MCDHPPATYSFLNESQAQIAHHCLEPELPGEGERERRIRFGSLYGIINSKAEISLCRKDASFLLGCTLVTKASFPLGLINTVLLHADLPLKSASFFLPYLGNKDNSKFISSGFTVYIRNKPHRDF